MAAPKPNPAPKPNRQVLFVAAALCIALVAGLGGFLAGRTIRRGGGRRRLATTEAAAGVPTAPTAPRPLRPHRRRSVHRRQGRYDWVTGTPAMFSIWVAFGPPDGGGTMCTVGGRSGYSRGIVIMVRSDLANKKPCAGPDHRDQGRPGRLLVRRVRLHLEHLQLVGQAVQARRDQEHHRPGRARGRPEEAEARAHRRAAGQAAVRAGHHPLRVDVRLTAGRWRSLSVASAW